MRYAGEPIFESDFSGDIDMIATLCVEPYGKERFEMELAARLRPAVQNGGIEHNKS